MYMKVQAHKAGQNRYGNEAEEESLLASQKSFGSLTGTERACRSTSALPFPTLFQGGDGSSSSFPSRPPPQGRRPASSERWAGAAEGRAA